MKKTFFKNLLLRVFVLCSTFSQAQHKKFSLQEAISFALTHKAEAIKSELQLQNARYEIAEARANALPNISTSAGVTYNIVQQETVLPGDFFGAPGKKVRLAFGQKWNANANASVSQMIFNQSVFMGLKAAKTTREFYAVNKDLTQEQLIEKVAIAYYQVYKAKQVLVNVQNNLNLMKKNAETIKGLFQAGLAKKIDLDRIEVAVNNLNSAKSQAQNRYDLAQNALKFWIGLPIETSLELPEQNFTIDYQKAFEREDKNEIIRTEIKLLEKQKDLLYLNKKAQIAQYFPTIFAVGTYGYLGQGGKNPLFFSEKDGVYWSDFSSVGLNVKIPIFNGLGTRAKVKKAKNQILSLEAEIQNTKLAMDLAYFNAKTQLTSSLLELKNQENNVKLAEEVFNNMQNNYKQGLATLTDFIEAERSLSDANTNFIAAWISYKLAEIELLKAQGKLKELQES